MDFVSSPTRPWRSTESSTLPRLRGPHLAGLVSTEDGLRPHRSPRPRPRYLGRLRSRGRNRVRRQARRNLGRPGRCRRRSRRSAARRATQAQAVPAGAPRPAPHRWSAPLPLVRPRGRPRRDLRGRCAPALVATGQDRRRPPREVPARRRPAHSASACRPCNDAGRDRLARRNTASELRPRPAAERDRAVDSATRLTQGHAAEVRGVQTAKGVRALRGARPSTRHVPHRRSARR